ncbi:MAG: hemin uptake protein HemP [Pseudomonadota bacterium]
MTDFSGQKRTELKRLAGEKKDVDDVRVLSADLFRNRQEIVIEHAGADYRLRITRQGKLILNK